MTHPRLPRLLGRLPVRFQWTLHNLVGHPISEILHQLGSARRSDLAHDLTVPVQGGRWMEPRTGTEPPPVENR